MAGLTGHSLASPTGQQEPHSYIQPTFVRLSRAAQPGPVLGPGDAATKVHRGPAPSGRYVARGIQYSDKGRDICGPNSLSRSLLLGEGRVQQGLRAEVMSFVSASGRGRDSKSFPDR